MEKETCRLEMPEGESYEQKRALSICLIGHVLDYMVDHSVIADYKPITNKSIYHYPKLAPDFNVQFKGKNFGLYVAVNDKDFYRIAQVPGIVKSPIIRASTRMFERDMIIHPYELIRSINEKLIRSNRTRLRTKDLNVKLNIS